jgi:pilus assembly protein CpaC
VKTRATRWGGWLLTLGVIWGLLAASASGADLLERVKHQEIVQSLRLRVGQSKVLRTPFPITRISVADPEVADIVLISEREVYVNGLAPGVTNLSIWGKSRFTSAMVTVEADVSILKEKLHKVLPKEKIGVEAAGDSVVLSGEVSGPVAQATAIALATPFAGGKKDKVVNLMHIGGVQQVMLEVRIAEIERDLLDRIGINTTIGSQHGNFGVTNVSSASLASVFSSLTSNATTAMTRGFAAASSPSTFFGGASFKAGGLIWTMFFDLLKERDLGRILAEPNLVTTSGQQASFLAGGEFPVPVPQSGVGGGTTITIDWKKFGTQLVFTPTVLDDGKIAMDINPEVSELDFTIGTSINGTVVPGIRTRRMSTHLETQDGQTFAMAGLLQHIDANTLQKYPVLGDIPVLGNLFRSNKWQNNETELVVLVTPHLAKPLAPGAVRLPTDKWAPTTDFDKYILGLDQGREQPTPPQSQPAQTPPGFGNQKLE